MSMTRHYYLKADHAREWAEVTREQYTAAFDLETSSFRGHGRIETVTDNAPTPEQPAPDAGEIDDRCSHSDKEWVLSRQNPADVKCDYDYIASASTRKHARQIVSNHHLAALVPGLLESLRQIAAYDDAGANEYLKQTGSYSKFDEPGAVRAARAALAAVSQGRVSGS